MFNKSQLDRIEKNLSVLCSILGVLIKEDSVGIYLPEKPVSPAKKRGRPAKKVTTKKK